MKAGKKESTNNPQGLIVLSITAIALMSLFCLTLVVAQGNLNLKIDTPPVKIDVSKKPDK